MASAHGIDPYYESQRSIPKFLVVKHFAAEHVTYFVMIMISSSNTPIFSCCLAVLSFEYQVLMDILILL